MDRCFGRSCDFRPSNFAGLPATSADVETPVVIDNTLTSLANNFVWHSAAEMVRDFDAAYEVSFDPVPFVDARAIDFSRSACLLVSDDCPTNDECSPFVSVGDKCVPVSPEFSDSAVDVFKVRVSPRPSFTDRNESAKFVSDYLVLVCTPDRLLCRVTTVFCASYQINSSEFRPDKFPSSVAHCAYSRSFSFAKARYHLPLMVVLQPGQTVYAYDVSVQNDVPLPVNATHALATRIDLLPRMNFKEVYDLHSYVPSVLSFYSHTPSLSLEDRLFDKLSSLVPNTTGVSTSFLGELQQLSFYLQNLSTWVYHFVTRFEKSVQFAIVTFNAFTSAVRANPLVALVRDFVEGLAHCTADFLVLYAIVYTVLRDYFLAFAFVFVLISLKLSTLQF